MPQADFEWNIYIYIIFGICQSKYRLEFANGASAGPEPSGSSAGWGLCLLWEG